MSDSNKIKIQQILENLFTKHRYIFWYDAGGEMEGFASDINIDGVETVVLDGNPFGVKYRIECGEQPVKGFLIYSKDEKPDDEDNWLLDIQEEGEILTVGLQPKWWNL